MSTLLEPGDAPAPTTPSAPGPASTPNPAGGIGGPVFVAVGGAEAGADAGRDAASDPRRALVRGRLIDAGLRAAVTAAPLAIASIALALGGDLLLRPVSTASAVLAFATIVLVLAMLAAARVAARNPRRDARRAGQRAYGGLGVAALALIALAPWLPGPPAPEGLHDLHVLLLGACALGACAAFAPLRRPALAAVLVPLSAGFAAWRGAEAGVPSAALGGFVAGALALGVGLLYRHAWLESARAAIARELHIRELEAARDDAERADQEKSRFLATASHDLRQPVHALGLFATTLEKRLRGSGEEPLIRNIVRSIDGLDRSFNAMLDVSRLDAGVVEPNFQHFPLRDLFRRLDMYFAGQAEQAHLGLRLCPGGKSVTSDPQLLERILGNLIQNAIKYTERGGIVVVARTTATHFNIEVWDTGVGIREADLPHIFEEFYQVGRRERARVQGLGMGLAIVKRLAQLLGHRLTVRSQPGRGTMFRIGIPVGGLPGIQDAIAAADTLPMAAPEPRAILIIDDEDAVREGLALLLEEWGYQAIAAASYHQAERLARTLDLPPDLILSDLHLGDGPDGIAAIEAVRQGCGCEVPAILITGDTSPDELRRATDSGYMVLFKPVQPRKLLAALRGSMA
jgi:signal transduction histidine kinase/CheY-like chemotaxis protein